jgi:hypothetical protein
VAHPQGKGSDRVGAASPWASLAAGLGAVLLPKCPLCLAAYGGALGALGAGTSVLLVPFICLAVGLVLMGAIRRRDGKSAVAAVAGGALVVAGRMALHQPVITAIGALTLIASATIASAARGRQSSCRPSGRPAP